MAEQYTATVTRGDGGWWIIQCNEVYNAYTQVQRIEEAQPVAREIIARMLDVPQSEVEVKVEVSVE